MSERWRGVAAALLNPDLRAVLSEAIGPSELPAARRQRAAARLVEIGLLREGATGLEFADDTAALRRHLVDAELLERTRSGSEYALVDARPPESGS